VNPQYGINGSKKYPRKTNQIRLIVEECTVFGLGLAVNRITRRALVASGVDKNTAKWIGRGAGWTASLISFDPSGFLDVPDIPDDGSS
jgi:hypothetical protein